VTMSVIIGMRTEQHLKCHVGIKKHMIQCAQKSKNDKIPHRSVARELIP